MLVLLKNNLHLAKSDNSDETDRINIKKHCQNLMDEEICYLKYKFREFRNVLAFHSDYPFLFGERQSILPDNNYSEWAIPTFES